MSILTNNQGSVNYNQKGESFPHIHLLGRVENKCDCVIESPSLLLGE